MGKVLDKKWLPPLSPEFSPSDEEPAQVRWEQCRCIHDVYKGKGRGEDEWQAQGCDLLEKDRERGGAGGKLEDKSR